MGPNKVYIVVLIIIRNYGRDLNEREMILLSIIFKNKILYDVLRIRWTVCGRREDVSKQTS